uniref:RNA helicase n=1 Tax=Trichuris muris TaxID=70415 RepID=A0A5S6PZF0_TRIMR
MFHNVILTRTNAKRSALLAENEFHPKGALFNFFHAMQWEVPSFTTTKTGSAHRPMWHCRVTFRLPDCENVFAFHSAVESVTKREAEKRAALSACQFLKEKYDHFPQKERHSAASVEESRNCEEEESREWSHLEKSPKSILYEFLHISNKLEFAEEIVEKTDGGMKASLSVSWPFEFNTSATRSSRKRAVAVVYWEWLRTLQRAGHFDHQFKPVFHSEEQIRTFKRFQLIPPKVVIPSDLQARMEQLIREYNVLSTTLVDSLERYRIKGIVNRWLADAGENALVEEDDIDDRLDDDKCLNRSHRLYVAAQRLLNSTDPVIEDVRLFRRQLPAFIIKSELLTTLEDHQVVVVAGDTGCGKTTQIPQFIFDDYVAKLKGAECNIVVTQPRRISAVSMANRIAFERAEELGETVGYNVRLSRCLPTLPGSIVFMTPGTFLRSAMFTDKVETISHVIIDEVHERDILTDLLLVYMKQKLAVMPSMKLILMSASIDTAKFSSFFDNCPIISTSGRLYEVEEHFMPDIQRIIGSERKTETTVPTEVLEVDVPLVADVVSWIHGNRPPGDILCFLPSWNDISSVRTAIGSVTDLVVLPCHSKLPLAEQRRIFDRVPSGQRKVVLATNIAETSITVENIRYVVNTGLKKAGVLATVGNWLSHRQQWASQSSQIQRKGRAGRHCEGECFHIFSREDMANMPAFETPAVQTAPLERLLLMTKALFQASDPLEMLSRCMDPPSPQGLESARRLLVGLDIFDEKNELTNVGKYVAHFGCHPFLGIALLYSIVLRCVEPILCIASVYESGEDFFESMPDEKSEVQDLFNWLVGSSYSYHTAMANLCRAAAESSASSADNFDRNSFFATNLLSHKAANFILALKEQFAEELTRSGIVEHADSVLSHHAPLNSFSNHAEMLKAALASGLYENVAKAVHGRVDYRGKIDPDAVRIRECSSKPIRIRRLGKTFMKDNANWWSDWFLYYQKIWNEKSENFVVDGLSMISPVVALLFSGLKPVVVNESFEEPRVIIQLGSVTHLRLQVETFTEAELLLRFRTILHSFVRLFLEHRLAVCELPANADVNAWHSKMLDILSEVVTLKQSKSDLHRYDNFSIESKCS